jgi:mannose-1-phosphate guanylyltransferase
MYKEERPWGSFETLYEGNDYKVKRIVINPNESFSLQFHRKRSEHWVIVEGDGYILVNNQEEHCRVGDEFKIGIAVNHRATAGNRGLVMIEVQRGECLEEDIVRIEDNYGRVRPK